MAKLFVAEDIKKVLTGSASEYCRIKMLQEGKYGKRMTKADFDAHKACIRDVYEKWVRDKIAGLVLPTLPTPK